MSGGRRFRPRVYRELVLHILHELGPMPEQKLENILFRIDFEAYRMLGKSITGATYVKVADGVVSTTKGRSRRRVVKRSTTEPKATPKDSAVVSTEPEGDPQ